MRSKLYGEYDGEMDRKRTSPVGRLSASATAMPRLAGPKPQPRMSNVSTCGLGTGGFKEETIVRDGTKWIEERMKGTGGMCQLRRGRDARC